MLYLHHFAIQVINVVAIVAGEENLLGEPSYKYLTADEMRGLGDDSMAIDVTHDEKQKPEGGAPTTCAARARVKFVLSKISLPGVRSRR